MLNNSDYYLYYYYYVVLGNGVLHAIYFEKFGGDQNVPKDVPTF